MNLPFPTPPQRMRTKDSSDLRLVPARDAFFEAVKSYLGFNKRYAPFMRIEYRELGVPNSDAPLLDSLTLLIIRDQAVASIIERRDEWNWTETTFACYLEPRLVDELREFVRQNPK